MSLTILQRFLAVSTFAILIVETETLQRCALAQTTPPEAESARTDSDNGSAGEESAVVDKLLLPLPAEIFSPLARKRDVLAHRECHLLEGPIRSVEPKNGEQANRVIIKCAVRQRFPEDAVEPGSYFVIVQPYYRPFRLEDSDRWYRGYASDAGFYELLSPPLDEYEKQAILCKTRLIQFKKDAREAILEIEADSSPAFVPGSWIRVFRSPLLEEEFDSVPSQASISFETDESPLHIAEDRLLRIGNAIHKYVGTLGHFPPAVVRGPDGKPWHTWRVLILPYLGEREHDLFRTYDLTKPWDDEHNQSLLAKMPEVFRFPGSDDNESYSFFAATVAEETMFPRNGCILPDEFRIDSFSKPWHAVRFPPNNSSVRVGHHISDGASNTILLGTVLPTTKIPWTQPVDVELDVHPVFDEAGGFSTPFEDQGNQLALLLFVDGRVDRVPSNLSPDTLSAISTVRGQERIVATELLMLTSLRKSPEYLGYPGEERRSAEFVTRNGKPIAVVRREIP